MGKKKMFMRTFGGYLLDLYPFAAGFSVSRIKNGAIRPFRIRRASDDAETDIYFNIDDSFDLSSMVQAGGTLGTWVGSSDAFVTIWYDQSGNSFDLPQTGTTRQPRIILSGVINLKNGLPAVDFTNTLKTLTLNSPLSALNNGNDFTIYSVSNPAASNSVGIIFTSNTSNTALRLALLCDSRADKRGGLIQTASGTYLANMSISRQNTNQRINMTSVDGVNKLFSHWDNNGVGGQNIVFLGNYTNSHFNIGSQHNDLTPLNGNVQEFLIRATEDTTTTREAIRDNINSRFTIY
jgi:hypothetical protein